MKTQKSGLPKQLTSLVNSTVAILGDVIKEEGGEKVFKTVDSIRKEMVEYRSVSVLQKDKILQKLYARLDKEISIDKHKIAHSFTLMLELINVCEAAFRTYKLRSQEEPLSKFSKKDSTMVYVLTAHPTEARTPENIELFSRIQKILVNILEKTAEQEYLESIIKHNLKLAWLLPVTKHEKPEVLDEAKHLFSIIFRKDIFDTLLRADRDLGQIRMRTWVGGDKDGHPGVDEKVMLACLQASRDQFLLIVSSVQKQFYNDLEMLNNATISQLASDLDNTFKTLIKLTTGDSDRLDVLVKQIGVLGQKYEKEVGAKNPRLLKLEAILRMFPGLVIPIELREDSEVIADALKSKKPLAIERMLVALSKIAKGQNIRHYAQGLIISMCQSYSDIENTIELSKKTIGDLRIPVIPLFETSQALEDSSDIIAKLLKNKEYTKNVKNNWNNHLEVMLGYSDSSKGMGVLPSRIAIAKTMRSLDDLISQSGFTPVFFHGSGGSVDRGGGSIKEQTAWWPKSALSLYKATIQGEMVERTFTSSEVTLSGIDKVLTNFKRVKTKKGKIKIDKAVEKFAFDVATSYKRKIADSEFFEMVEAATPYSYLNVLRLGSRPTKRASEKTQVLDFNSIRAIPWILCWTQTRILFPSWWGVGTSWDKIRSNRKESQDLKDSYESSYLFSSYVRTLGFTLSKVDLSIFKLYLSKSSLSNREQEKVFEEFKAELKLVEKFLVFITGEKKLLWNKPWLADSIKLRSSMIHPLNILQIQGNRDSDEALVRKTVAGISSGMMTTG
jgi:phosphoenolpyruvate carboxylase